MDLIESDVKVFEFDMKLVGWILNILVFLKLWYLMKKKIKFDIPIWNENIWSMNCINIPYWAVSSFPIVENFQVLLVRVRSDG